jgi:ABC-type multidrug transport system fused ATPase/permease subunit
VNFYSLKIIIEILESGTGQFVDVAKVVLIFVAINSVLSIISAFYYKKYCPVIEQKIKTSFKSVFFHKVSKTKLIHFEDSNHYNDISKAGDVVEKNIINTCDYFFGFIGTVCEVLLLSSVVIIFNFRLLFVGILFIVINLLLSFLTSRYGYIQYERNVKNIRKQNYISSLFANKRYAEELKIYDFSPFLIRQYDKITEYKIKNIKKYSVKISILTALQKLMQLSLVLIIIIVLVGGVLKGTTTLGVFSAMLVATQNFVSSFSSLFSIIPNMKKESLYIKNYVKFMEMEDDYQGSLECVFENLTITTKNLSFSYPGSEKLVLDSVNMNINDNKKIALIGPNGAGKTTLVKLLIGLFPPQNGVILYNQDDLTEISRYQLYDRVAVIPQNFNIYEFTIAENLLMREYTEEDETNVKTVLQRIGLYEKVQALKNKENTVLGKMFEENGTEFSGGEKQKIAIGRALIREPEIIIMDEATASLDPLAEKEIIDLSMELFKDKKMIIISHRLSMALQTDYIYLLDEGKIAEEGTHNELMEIKGKYYELFTTQASKYGLEK